MDKFDAWLVQHAAEARDLFLSPLPSLEELPAVSYPKSFQRRMGRLIKQQRRSPRTNQMLRYLKQTTAAVLVIATFTLGGLMTVEAHRETVLNIIIQVFEEFTYYQFTSNPPEEVEQGYLELPEIQFGYLPEGMTQTEYRTYDSTLLTITYEVDQDHFFQFSASLIRNGVHGKVLDTEDSNYWEGTLHGCEAYFNTKHGHSSVVWTDKNIVYDLYGYIDIQELIAVAKNIKISHE